MIGFWEDFWSVKKLTKHEKRGTFFLEHPVTNWKFPTFFLYNPSLTANDKKNQQQITKPPKIIIKYPTMNDKS